MSMRIEQKLAVDASRLPELDRFLTTSGATLLHPDREVISVYLDTPMLALYRESNEGSVPRIKVRVRCYGPCTHVDEPHSLETKTSSVEGRHKTAHVLHEVQSVLAQGLEHPAYGWLRPTTVVSYQRAYYAMAGVRVTVDRDIVYRQERYEASHVAHDPHVAVEIKAAVGHSLDELVDTFPFPRTRFSKYARSIEALGLH